MKHHILLCFILLGGNHTLQADIVYLNQRGHARVELSPAQTDFFRENLIHIFDSSNFHQMQGGALPVKSQKQLKQQLESVQSGSFIELRLDEPARIVVEGTELKATRMWVRIRESDGLVYDWILQQPNGDLVSLEKARGELIVQLAPHIIRLLKAQR
ncbi:MAG: hypothetical protein ACSHX8_07915 [Opitutaceae bacterium]